MYHIIIIIVVIIVVINALTGRSQVLRPDVLEKFQRFSLETGILPENIVPLPQNGTSFIQ